jgi:hypothetical protein
MDPDKKEILNHVLELAALVIVLTFLYFAICTN